MSPLVGPTSELVASMRLVQAVTRRFSDSLPVFNNNASITPNYKQPIIAHTLNCGSIIELNNSLVEVDSDAYADRLKAAQKMVGYVKILERQRISDCCMAFGVRSPPY